MTERQHARGAGGRPRKAPDEKRTERLSGLRLTAAERVHVEAQAALAGLPVAEFARRAVLGIKIAPARAATDERAIAEVYRVGVNLAQILKALHFGRGIPNDIADTMAEVRSAMERLAHDGS
ncbi:plasmid mobilization protein [Agrobacterium rubi]|uniref:Mobilization protein n=2 Tax=Agrobacterium rubi TaxID=28099 RepID=A0AAE7UUB9_9HYPH|nr:hypothetical protein [Agrobacterium rubi]MBP1881606.1 hypothetical protein [Agrobacterium rubi]NTE89640.1 hypothetical protein [Agrobacterium rubi]NTF05510.1 hypothetical protein [Agrobacterium rubi]NTF39953.1 hypothetical protein [Agrobacterium rubi]OCJ44752.1 hypothetical protein A6U92_16005 [Agrobacterium rubi]